MSARSQIIKLTDMSNKTFSFPAGASMEEVEELVGQGLDAMFDAHYAGKEGVSVVFGKESIVLEAGQDTQKDDKGDDDDKKTNENADVRGDDDEEEEGEYHDLEEVCVGCFENPCVFFRHEELLVAFDEAEHGEELVVPAAGEAVPSNNVRRKKLYRQLTLMLNGGPMGAGVRRPLPDCCVAAIRDMLPSDNYMGFQPN
jgi:hypothetical protein